MKEFIFYFIWGWDHIITKSAIDHILFIASIAIVFKLSDWKSLLLLVTAFTIGHMLTLWLTAAKIIQLSSVWIESMIPVTIALSALFNLFDFSTRFSLKLHYFIALFFGLIHGMGYANAIGFTLTRNQDLIMDLFAFNIGLEVGQIIVISLVVAMGEVFSGFPRFYRNWWTNGGSIIILLCSMYMFYQRIAG